MKFPKLEPRNVQLWFKNHRAKVKRVRLEICRQRQQEMNDAAAAVSVASAASATLSIATSQQQQQQLQQQQQQLQQQQQRRVDAAAAFNGALRLGVQPVTAGIFTTVPGSSPFPALTSSR